MSCPVTRCLLNNWAHSDIVENPGAGGGCTAHRGLCQSDQWTGGRRGGKPAALKAFADFARQHALSRTIGQRPKPTLETRDDKRRGNFFRNGATGPLARQPNPVFFSHSGTRAPLFRGPLQQHGGGGQEGGHDEAQGLHLRGAGGGRRALHEAGYFRPRPLPVPHEGVSARGL